MNRRRFLKTTGALGLSTLAASLPVAHADSKLDVTITPTHASFTEPRSDRWGDTNHAMDGLTLELENHEPEPITPVVFLWGQYQWMMQSWPPRDDPGTIQPGATTTLEVEAPGPNTRLYPEQPAQITVVNHGEERRAKTRFVPVEVNHVVEF